MNSKFQPLFEKLTLRNGRELKNRVVMAPMTNFASHEDGTVSQDELKYYARRSGGAGMVITACTYVTPNGKGFPGEFGGHSDEMIESLRSLAATIKEQGAAAVLQIFHGGRSCPANLVPDGDVVSASAIPAEAEGAVTPRELTEAEVDEIIKAFGDTTRRAIQAGFDGVEIHGANGYLVQQFFSPHSNRRTDRFGGSLEKRMTFPLAIVEEVKKVVAAEADPSFIVGYRFSPEEPETPGITMEDTAALVNALAEQQLDYLHISLMEIDSKARRGADPSRTRLELVLETIAGRTPLIGVGSIHTPDEAVAALESGSAMVALGRELIMEPDWVEKVQQGREAEIRTTVSKDDQAELVVPDALWAAIINSPGWFPVK
ncbi:NADH-dependent flavin oxidoreductase [Paenibacillus swuensis]|uniref:NADH-dependent flavin oxidoreductase n=1 Tax=Paenibacillus swuensis TaxID=1178515 RepID=A0A172TP26_9BACL|nr:NADH-dependent flavin oxidoreductase [Paenibacillus swuensis]ANE48839.1 NADH-dependent flavin oxidoreductase [Paenibacillus swuensis]